MQTTIAEVTRRLAVTNMTLHLWRRGTPARPPLASTIRRQGKAHRVTIHDVDLKEWLARWRPDLLRQWNERAANDNRSYS